MTNRIAVLLVAFVFVSLAALSISASSAPLCEMWDSECHWGIADNSTIFGEGAPGAGSGGVGDAGGAGGDGGDGGDGDDGDDGEGPEGSRPGHGHGDSNHGHTGPPGQSDGHPGKGNGGTGAPGQGGGENAK